MPHGSRAGRTAGQGMCCIPLVRLGDWLRRVANSGCLINNALAQYPDSVQIAQVVRDTGTLAAVLFILDEGMTKVSRLQGVAPAIAATMEAARALLKAHGID